MIVAFLQLCLVVSVSVQVYGTDGVCKCSTSGEVMDCSYRNCLNFTDECPGNIKVLNMSGNGITELYNDYFTKCLLVNIKEVYLDNNNISKIAKFAFQGLDRVTTIDLSGNNISSSEDDLINVSKLSLAGNPLKNFKIPENLKFLNLSSCQLQSGSNLLSYLNENRKLTTLDLSSNNLTDWEEIHKYVRPMTQLESIYVANNPWVCNCPRDANETEYMKTKVRGDEPKCGSPEVVSGSSLWNFTCPIPTTTTMANTITTTEPATTSESTIPTNPTTIEDITTAVTTRSDDNTSPVTTLSDDVTTTSPVTIVRTSSSGSDTIALACLCAASILVFAAVVVYDYLHPDVRDQWMTTVLSVHAFPRPGIRWNALCPAPGDCELSSLQPKSPTPRRH